MIVLGVFGWLFIQSIGLPYLLNWSPPAVFLMFGIITITGFFYIVFFIKDTHGLTDKEKKSLYTNNFDGKESFASKREQLMNKY